MNIYYKEHPKAKAEADAFNVLTKQRSQQLTAARVPSVSEYIIPVVFHVFGTTFNGGTQVTTALIQDALNKLNNDFKGLTANQNDLDPTFSPIRRTLNISFRLATKDPSGNPTTGVTYHANASGFGNGSGYDAQIRQYAWDNYKYMNVYIMRDLYGDGVTNNSGVAWYPDTYMSNNNIARVVYNGSYLSTNTDENFRRVLTHEFGHFMNLIHTFEGGCTDPNDQVSDTPASDRAGMGDACRTGINCRGQKINGENFMDYSSCYKMFTNGQVDRMITALEDHAARRPLWQPANLAATLGIGTSDTQAPTAPANLTASNITTTSVQLSWTASTDNVGVTGYDIFRGTTNVGSTASTSFNVTGLTANTAYSFTVKAKDAAGNISAASNTVNVTTGTSSDTQAPSAPANLSASNITQNSVQLNWSASTDNVGVAGYTIFQGSTSIGTSTSTTYTATGLTASTAYTFSVKARDAAGNISASSNVVSATTSPASTGSYCTVSNGSSGQYITKVVFGSINNASGFTTGGYANYTSLSTTVVRGTTVSLQITLQQLWAGSRAGAWIDWNKDGDFADAGEQVLNASGTNAASYTISVSIPTSALTGSTRMRIRSEYGLSSISPCGNGWHSEVEDYSITTNATGPEQVKDAFGNKEELFQLFPNPSNGSFSVVLPEKSKEVSVHVYNSNGALVGTLKKKLNTDEQQHRRVDVKMSLHSGLHLVRVRTDIGSQTKQLIIE